MRMWSQVSSPLYNMENNSSSKVIPSTLGNHGGGGKETVYKSFYQWQGWWAQPCFLMLEFTSSSTTWEQSPTGPRVATPHLLPLSPLFTLLCHSGLRVPLSLRQFPTQGPPCCFPCLDALPQVAAGPTPFLQASAQMSLRKSFLTTPYELLPLSVAIACFMFHHSMYHLLLCCIFVLY